MRLLPFPRDPRQPSTPHARDLPVPSAAHLPPYTLERGDGALVKFLFGWRFGLRIVGAAPGVVASEALIALRTLCAEIGSTRSAAAGLRREGAQDGYPDKRDDPADQRSFSLLPHRAHGRHRARQGRRCRAQPHRLLALPANPPRLVPRTVLTA